MESTKNTGNGNLIHLNMNSYSNEDFSIALLLICTKYSKRIYSIFYNMNEAERIVIYVRILQDTNASWYICKSTYEIDRAEER